MPRISQFCLLLSLLTGAPDDAPIGVPIDVQENLPDLLTLEAGRYLNEMKIKRSVERIIARKNIRGDQLPDPASIPSGSVKLRTTDEPLLVGDTFFTRVTWSTNVSDDVDSQFTYHVHIAYFIDSKYDGGYRTWGVALARYNGNEYVNVTSSRAKQPGHHRMLGILCAYSIKTEEVHILDVDEIAYSVAAR